MSKSRFRTKIHWARGPQWLEVKSIGFIHVQNTIFAHPLYGLIEFMCCTTCKNYIFTFFHMCFQSS